MIQENQAFHEDQKTPIALVDATWSELKIIGKREVL